MTLGELESKLKEIKENLKEFGWTEEKSNEVEVYLGIEDAEGGIEVSLENVTDITPPLAIYLSGEIADLNYRITFEKIKN